MKWSDSHNVRIDVAEADPMIHAKTVSSGELS